MIVAIFLNKLLNHWKILSDFRRLLHSQSQDVAALDVSIDQAQNIFGSQAFSINSFFKPALIFIYANND